MRAYALKDRKTQLRVWLGVQRRRVLNHIGIKYRLEPLAGMLETAVQTALRTGLSGCVSK